MMAVRPARMRNLVLYDGRCRERHREARRSARGRGGQCKPRKHEPAETGSVTAKRAKETMQSHE
jgi:hypothetical protein